MKHLFALSFLLFCFETFGSIKRRYSLDFLGFATGVTQKNSKSLSRVYFNIPSKKWIDSAELDLRIQYSPLLKEGSFLRVTAEGELLGTLDIGKDNKKSVLKKRALRLTIPRRLLNKGFLNIEFFFHTRITNDPCFDDSLVHGMAQLDPESALVLSLKTRPHLINDYLSSLPVDGIKIQLPERVLNDKEGRHFFELTSFLKMKNRNYQIVRGNSVKYPYFIFGTTNEILEKFNIDKEVENRDSANRPANALMSIFTHKGSAYFIINSDYEGSLRPLLSGLAPLLLQKKVLKTGALSANEGKRKYYLSDLSLSTKGEQTALGQDWNTKFPVSKLESYKTPKKLFLSLTSNPLGGGKSGQLFVYQNDQLLEVVDLKNSGSPEAYLFDLTPFYKDQFFNLQLKARFPTNKGSCLRNELSFNEVRLHPDSYILFEEEATNKGKTFSDFGLSLKGGLSVYLPGKMMNDPTILSSLSTLTNSLFIFADDIQFKNSDEESPLISKRPFIFVSQRDSYKGLNGPFVSKKRNHILQSRKALKSFNISELEDLAILQTVEGGKSPGLNLHFSTNTFETKTPYFSLGRDNLFIFNKEKKLLNLNTHTSDLKDFSFASENDISFLYDKYRYVLLILLWIFLTLVLVKLVRKFK